jgi:hypothetical protein
LESGGIKLRKETTGYDGTTLGDAQSGNSYREKIHGDGSENKVIFTLPLNVDGAQCFEKSKFGFWSFMRVNGQKFLHIQTKKHRNLVVRK